VHSPSWYKRFMLAFSKEQLLSIYEALKKDPVQFSDSLRTFYKAHCSQPPKITKVRISVGQKQMLKLALQKEIYLCFVPLKKQKKGKKALFNVKKLNEYLPGLKKCPFPQDITITSWIKELFPKMLNPVRNSSKN